MRAKNKNKVYLINILFVLDFKVNFLSSKRIYQKDLYKIFNKHNI